MIRLMLHTLRAINHVLCEPHGYQRPIDIFDA